MENKRIKILFVVNSLKRRGAEQQLFSFIKALPERINVSVFSFSNRPDDFPEFFAQDRIKVYLNPYQGTFNPFKIKPLVKSLKRVKPDVVMTVGLGAALLLGRLVAVALGTRVVYGLFNTFENFNNLPRRSDDYFDIMNKGVNILISRLPKHRIFRLFANSNRLAKRVASEVSTCPVHTLYNGLPIREIDTILSKNSSYKVRSIVKKLTGHPTIVQVGALDQNKNLGFTLDCLQVVRKQIPNVRLLVIGDGPLRENLEKYAFVKNLGNHVIFAGQMDHADCLHLIHMSDIITLTSDSESFPNVLVEGQALGLPAVTLNVGAANEIVLDGVTGFVVRPKDKKDFVNKLTRVLSEKERSRQFGENGVRRAVELFGMQKKIESFLYRVNADLEALTEVGSS